jgi:hypothetical protein
MPQRESPPAGRTGGRADAYLDRDLDEVLDRLPPDLVRDEPDLARVEPDFVRVESDFARVEPDFARDELDFARDELDFARDELDFARDEDARERDDVEREPPLDELDERLRDDRRRDEPPLRSAAGISSRATAFASWSICFSRNFAIRSSSRLMLRASFAVVLSPTVSASDSMPA